MRDVHSTSKQTTKHLISPANLELRDTRDICTAVFTARTFVCLPGTDLSPCQELRAQQVTGQCHPMGEGPVLREVRSQSIISSPAGRWEAEKGTTVFWWKQKQPYGVGKSHAEFEQPVLWSLKQGRKDRSMISFSLLSPAPSNSKDRGKCSLSRLNQCSFSPGHKTRKLFK